MKMNDTGQLERETFSLQLLATDRVRVLLVVEGTNDIEFLKRISVMLHGQDGSLPNLAGMERQGELIFVPFCGGQVAAWTHRLAPLGKPEFHLYDRELPPETDYRIKAAKAANRRTQCRAVLTQKRSIENYLHPQAILAASAMTAGFDDFDPVAEMIAKGLYQSDQEETPWEVLSRRARRRLTCRAKRWLNTRAVDHMTSDLLHQRDPNGEVISWLRDIRRLVEAD